MGSLICLKNRAKTKNEKGNVSILQSAKRSSQKVECKITFQQFTFQLDKVLSSR